MLDRVRSASVRAICASSPIVCLIAAAQSSADVVPDTSSAVWFGGDGRWSDPENWASRDADLLFEEVFIDADNPVASSALLDIDVSINGLDIDAGDLVNIEGHALRFAGANLESHIDNAGVIQFIFGAQPSTMIVGYSGDLSLMGGGQVLMTDAQHCLIHGEWPDARLVNVDNTIAGTGAIGVATMGLHNSGVIDANLPYQDLVVEPNGLGVINLGLLQASNAGRLRLINGSFHNGGGVIQALSGSRVELDGSAVAGGLLATEDNGLLRVMDAPATLENVTIEGTFELGPVQLSFKGTIVNDGFFSVAAGETFAPPEEFSEIILPPNGGDVNLVGSGLMDMRWCKIHSGANTPGGRLINGPDHRITGEGLIGMNTTGLVNYGTIIATRPNPIVIDPPPSDIAVNYGLLQASGEAGLVFTGGSFQNDGTLEVLNGSRAIYTSSATEIHISGGMLAGGTWRVLGDESPTLLLIPGSEIFFNQADVTLSGPGSTFQLIDSMTVNDGHFTIRNGRNFQTSGAAFINSGELTIGMDSVFTALANFEHQSTGVLRIEIGGGGEEMQGPSLVANGVLTLAGSLELAMAPGVAPSEMTITIVEAGAIGGEFASVSAPAGFSIAYESNQIILTIDPVCSADINSSGSVDLADLMLVISSWGRCPGTCPADVSQNGAVDVADLVAVIDSWGACE
jgi:hypothetical protein